MSAIDAPTPFEPHVETIVVLGANPATVHIQEPAVRELRSLCGRVFDRSNARYAIHSVSEVYCKTCVKLRSVQ